MELEALLKQLAAHVALAAELVCVLCITIGGVLAVGKTAVALAQGAASGHKVRREIWMTFAAWIILALEFALGADIVRTAIAPTWNDIGQLASIAVIRTALNYFLERDMEAFEPKTDLPPSRQPEPPAGPAEPPKGVFESGSTG